MHIHHKHQHMHKRQFGLPSFDSGSDIVNDISDDLDRFGDRLGGGNNGFGQREQSQQQPQQQQQQVQQPQAQRQEQSDPETQNNKRDDDVATKVSVVFVTASPTFDGPVRGYTTLGDEGVAQNTVKPTPANTPKETPTPVVAQPTPSQQATNNNDDDDNEPATTQNIPPKVTSKPVETETQEDTPIPIRTTSRKVVESESESESEDTFPTPTKSAKTSLTDSIEVTPTSAAAETSDASAPAIAAATTSAAAQANDGGMSGGAKAGLAIGLILLILLIAGGVFALMRHKKNKEVNEVVDEKNPFGDSAAAAAPAPSSMRPITPPHASAPRAAPAAAMSGGALPGQARDGQASNPANPFGNHAETVPATQPSGHPAAAPMAAGVSPAAVPAASGTGDMEKAALAAGAGAGAGALIGAAVSNSDGREKGPKPAEVKTGGPFSPALAAMPGSPASSQFSNNSMTSVAMANGEPTSNVHRVQLDFKPSMDDELELKAGQLVRLLHEYDDGWALCIRLDRTQQGVVPRTCLSGRPVKPRAPPQNMNGPPRGPPRGPPPPGMRMPPGPLGPHGPPRAGSPSPLNVPRAHSPALAPNPTQRSMSPGPYGGGPQQQRPRPEAHARSSSDTLQKPRIISPSAGSSPMNPNKEPAVQKNSTEFQLPIQIPRPLTPQGQSSTPSTPVLRKPLPGQWP